jgi:hypothetical protein
MEIRTNVLGMYQSTGVGNNKIDAFSVCVINFLIVFSAIICVMAMLNPFMSEIRFKLRGAKDILGLGDGV